jgi:hypothetical protein
MKKFLWILPAVVAGVASFLFNMLKKGGGILFIITMAAIFFWPEKPVELWIAKNVIKVHTVAYDGNDNVLFELEAGDTCVLLQEVMLKMYLHSELLCKKGRGWVIDGEFEVVRGKPSQKTDYGQLNVHVTAKVEIPVYAAIDGYPAKPDFFVQLGTKCRLFETVHGREDTYTNVECMKGREWTEGQIKGWILEKERENFEPMDR